MNVNGVTGQIRTYSDETYKKKNTEKKTSDSVKTESTENYIYESSSNDKQSNEKQIYSNKNDRSAIVEQLKADAQQRADQLQNLVSKMLSKQGLTITSLEDAVLAIKNGNVNVDADTIAKAKKDTAEDGYWGVKQTSERIVSFAKALAGDDPDMADKMIEAFKKGYNQAAKVLGGSDSMPDLCKQTYDETMKQLNEWKDGIE
ncbi:MAG: hypothetical protein PUB10_08875 [Clostridiales bacterium]|nr:hypothetical protein [Clostridiales bacterium]